MNRILVAYASRHGSTAEVAEAVAQVLRDAGARVDVVRAREVRSVELYDGVILGSACRVGRVLPEAVAFARRHRDALMGKAVAYFDVGLTMKDDTPENRAVAEGCLQELRLLREPVRIGTFAGKLERKRLGAPLRFLLARAKPDIPEGDFRDWGAIRAWARELAPLLLRSDDRPPPREGGPSRARGGGPVRADVAPWAGP